MPKNKKGGTPAPISRIDCDCLLYGKPTWEQVVEFWKSDNFDSEEYLVMAIETHLLTQLQRKILFDNNLSIEKMLNGRTETKYKDIKDQIYSEWNQKLGFKSFGF